MSKREPVSKKTRFEVFKRDKFTCQYCGAKAPEAVLHADHINPVAEGGKGDILNLITACAACNGGKGARKLDDHTTLDKQRQQVEDLEIRREQLEMLLAWRDAAVQAKTDEVDVIADRLGVRGGFSPNESGRAHLRRWLREYTLAELLEAADEALDVYLRFDRDSATQGSWEVAFKKMPGIANIRRQAKDKPYLPRLFYIQGILRKRLGTPRCNYVDALEEMVTGWMATVEILEARAKRASGWDEFQNAVERSIEESRTEEERRLIDLYMSDNPNFNADGEV